MTQATLSEPGVARSGVTRKDSLTHHRQPHRQELRGPDRERDDPALDLRQIKAGDDDFGLMTYDPAFTNTASCKSRDHLHRRRQGHPQLPRLPDRAARREEQLPRDGLPAPERRAADAGRSTTPGSYDITHHTMVHENIKELMDGLPLRRPPDGHADVDGGRALHVLPRGQAHPRPASRAASRSSA